MIARRNIYYNIIFYISKIKKYEFVSFCINIESKVNLGKANISKNNRNSEITLQLECDCGNINVGK